MGYTELTTVYEGAEEYRAEYNDDIPKDQKDMQETIAATQRFAYDNSDATVEIFTLHHPHVQGIECECVQYLTDHHPYWKQEGKNEKK